MWTNYSISRWPGLKSNQLKDFEGYRTSWNKKNHFSSMKFIGSRLCQVQISISNHLWKLYQSFQPWNINFKWHKKETSACAEWSHSKCSGCRMSLRLVKLKRENSQSTWRYKTFSFRGWVWVWGIMVTNFRKVFAAEGSEIAIGGVILLAGPRNFEVNWRKF